MMQPGQLPNEVLDALEQKDVTIKGTSFHIEALLPMEGFDVLEEIREVAVTPANLATVLANPNEAAVKTTFLLILAGLPKSVVKSIQRQMFQSVTFTNASAQTARVLSGSEPMAFQPPMTAFDVYGMTVRCLAINFLESSLDFLSQMSLPDQITES